MKAIVLTEDRHLEAREVPPPIAGAGQSIVRVTHTGICATDQKIYQGGIKVSHPLIMGHEMSGELIEGGGRDGVRPGARVIVDPVLYCGQCYHCRAGQTHICPNGSLLGRDSNGGFAERVAVPAANVYPLPLEIGAEEAPLLQVMTTCVHGHRNAEIFPGEAVVVMGLGVTGQIHSQIAKARGAAPVIGITRNKWKREVAQSLGADLTFAPGEEALEGVMKATGGRGADLVIESVGQTTTLAEAMKLVRIGGRIMGFGIMTDREGALPFYDFYYKEIQFLNARAAKSEDYPTTIGMVASGAVKLGPLLTHHFELDKLDEAIAMLDAPGDRLKIVLSH
jgi:2-desacetyl-2-hydroxyethyl bacteriochlorophyllide A dehydrogenase